MRCADSVDVVGAVVLRWNVFLMLCMAHGRPLDFFHQLHALVIEALDPHLLSLLLVHLLIPP